MSSRIAVDPVVSRRRADRSSVLPRGGATVSRMTEGLPVYYLDGSGGLEDVLAVAYFAGLPRVHLAGVGLPATAGADRRDAIRRLLDETGLQGTPVACAEGPARQDRRHLRDVRDLDNGRRSGDPAAATEEASTGAGGSSALIVRLAREHRGRLRIVTLGSLTGLAAALEAEPGLPALVRDVTVTGGTVFAAGDSPEAFSPGCANLAVDPVAAAAVLAAEWPVTLVPSDVTADHCLDAAHVGALLAGSGPLPRALAGAAAAAPVVAGPASAGLVSASSAQAPDRVAAPIAVGVATGELVAHSAPTMQLAIDLAPHAHRGRLRSCIVDLTGGERGFSYRDRTPHQCRVILSLHRAAGAVVVRRALGVHPAVEQGGRESLPA